MVRHGSPALSAMPRGSDLQPTHFLDRTDERALSGVRFTVRTRARIFPGRDVYRLRPWAVHDCDFRGGPVRPHSIADDPERGGRRSLVFAPCALSHAHGARAVDLPRPGCRSGQKLIAPGDGESDSDK